VILLRGCVEAVLEPEFRAAAVRLLARAGYQVVEVQGEGCCGSLTHHMGREASGHAFARHNIDLWSREIEAGGVDAILTTASGCGSTMKDYGFMFQADPAYAGKAKAVAAKTRDITEFLAEVGLPEASAPQGLTVAYHAACSLQHGQRVRDLPKQLLTQAGFTVREPLESHLCCGSAGIYNITQPEIADQLRDRKVASLEATKPQVIASGNIGCLTQIGAGTGLPVVHTVQLLDWAHGGPNPLR
jgi:glycolate oxidase iron-sulfur subunit